jgi:hypothetical protein
MAGVALSAAAMIVSRQQNLMPFQHVKLHPPAKIPAIMNKSG